MLCIRCSSALISLPGSNLISIPGSNFISFLATISSAFLTAISSASWQQTHQLHSAAGLVTEGRIHTWMSSDSQLTRPLHSASSKTWLQSPLPVH
ncbi:unnamed protein product [Staurois parvus]|uniref:Uncharacterized protein n=1 Tax=Staurois parvus TaxID=386267 RepID=A0ABN9HEG0_9NEOB|nr:unnamed protein product [Staurois parvus]